MNIAIGQLQKYAGPDARVTAQANITGSTVTNPWFTGVWDSDSNSKTPLTWLVSGNETSALSVNAATNLNRTSASPDTALTASDAGRVRLLGPATARMSDLSVNNITNGAVVVPAVAIKASPPGFAAGSEVTIGRYAYWVGDEGVKASLGLPDRSTEVTYAPWDTLTQRQRIRQQIGSSPSYFRTTAATSNLPAVRLEGFDPQSTSFQRNILSQPQFALVAKSGSIEMPDFMKDRYHDFTGSAFSVLANTFPASSAYRGLMHDLSLKPDDLGTAFKAYANHDGRYDPTTKYMETPGGTSIAGSTAPLLAITSVDSPRRRYKMMAVPSNAAPGLPEIGFSVAPVLANFYLQFSVARSGTGNPASSTNLAVQSRIYVTLWNPYSTAFAPSTSDVLSLDVDLPTITADGVPVNLNQSRVSASSGGVTFPFSDTARYNGSYGSLGELATWFPGRVYSWVTPSGGTSSVLGFYNNTLTSNWNDQTVPAPVTGNQYPSITIPESTITVRLKLNGTVVSTYKAVYDEQVSSAPPNDPATPPTGYQKPVWRFGFTFRINQPRGYSSAREWLKEYDPRAELIDQAEIVASDSPLLIPFGTDSETSSAPLIYSAQSPVTTSISNGTVLVSNLLYRVQGTAATGMSTYNDVSLFELPRLPILSAGELQHLKVKDKRPYAIGNSWGGTATNVIFDRFFFSGIPLTGNRPTLGVEPLPNWNLTPVNAPDVATLRSDADATKTALSSRYLLQAGGFNINSTSIAAWRAVLSSVRFSTAAPFTAVSIDNTASASSNNAGTQNGNAVQSQTFSVDTSLGAVPSPVFFRLPQSAQEVFQWQTVSSSNTNRRQFTQTSAFRVGVRGFNDSATSNGFSGETGIFTTSGKHGTNRQHLTVDQIELLAEGIVGRIRARFDSKGPFVNLQDFLSEPDLTDPADGSLLEAAIKKAGMNATEVTVDANWKAFNNAQPGFSTLTLTQADVITALAPYMKARSDTFLVRTYGEVINPITGTVDATAWGEATVQRFPETVDSGDDISQPNQPFGRRFKIISFRWLSSADI
ncbi:hypothetical protein RAHE111665_07050 [Rariglobus hedericola]